MNFKIAQMKNESTMDATKYVQAIWYMAAHDAFGFCGPDLHKIQVSADDISNRIMSGEYDFETLIEDLKEIGVCFC